MTGGKDLGVTLSRTSIPTLPSGNLSRKRLFPLLENDGSGTTFVIAPGGYGKSSLVAEWARYQSKSVIWMTVTNGDTLNEMSAMMITATRNVIPDFAPWFENEHPIRPTEVVRRWGNELLATKREFVFVLDNLRSEASEDVDIAIQLIEQFPSNVHFVVLRRSELPGIYATCASRGPIKSITSNELRFSADEIALYASNNGIETTSENLEILSAANGWPSATSLLRANLQAKGENLDLAQLISTESEPLRALAMLVIKNLNFEILDICDRLSIFESFTINDAEFVLGDRFSFDLINRIAHRGEIFSPAANPRDGYIFSPMVRQIFLERLRSRGSEKLNIHRSLIGYYESAGLPNLAIDHAFEAGEQEKISSLFPDAARAKQAQGLGGDLLRWSHFAGDTSVEGELKKATVRVTGYLADLDFKAAQSEISRIHLLAPQSAGVQFFEQFADAASCYLHISLGKFDELEEMAKKSLVGTDKSLLGVDDQINVLRLLATKRYIFNESDGVEEICEIVEELAKQTSLYTSHTFLLSIRAMYLHQRGEYKRAHETALISLQQHQRYGFTGSHGPLDAMFIIARCLLEFSRPQEALAIFDQIRSSAYQWKQWHWYFTCDKHIIEFLSFNEKIHEALERIKISREFAATLDSTHELSQIIDISEMSIRRRMKDFDRLENLVNRAPATRDTQQFRMAVDEFRGAKRLTNLVEEAKSLPTKTPRDKIWKHLMDASLNIEIESIALPAMKKALIEGSKVGARETFLRQNNAMGNLIIRIANELPTVYNEELATAMAARIKERGVNMAEARQALTKRELEILRQLSTGRTLTVIAGELHISQNTMKTHLKNLYKKMGAEGRHDAVEKAKAQFLI
jgi:ATP/maltotriose-dependent transcriptional regulator MalT